MTTVRTAAPGELDVPVLYAMLRLRVDVFVVEQECPYAELDGRDLDPGTRHLWTEQAGRLTSYLRLLEDADGDLRIGRVCTAPAHRGRGLAEQLVLAALAVAGDRPVVLDAQSHLQAWYSRFGFAAAGPEFLEDGIPHVPMRREPQSPHAD